MRASACDPFPSLSPQLKKQRTLQALFQQLEGLSRRLPVVAVFEDAHWIDPTSRELLDLIVERLHALPVLLIVTFRPEFQAPWRGQPQVTDLALGPLDRRDRAALAAQVAGDKSLPDEVIAQIVDRTDGVPLFVEELTRSMLESGVLREEDDRFVLDETLKPLAIPTTLQASLMARLDRSAPLRRIAQVGAAIGREFSYTLISAVSRLSEVDLQAALDRLVASGLAFQRGAPPDAVYRFKHALVQDAAYSTLLRGKRRMLHATIAEKLTERFPESAETAPETIAQHLTEAGAYAAAADQWARAGAWASRRAAYAEAVHHLGRGLSVLEQLPVGPERARCEAELHLRLAEVYRAKLGICAHEVSRSFKRALDLGDELKDDNIRAAAGNGYQNFLFNCGQLDASVQVCEELLNNFPSTDASLRMYLTHTLGCADYMRGNLATGQKHLEMAHSLFSAAKRPMGVDALQYDFVSAVNTQAHLATVYWLQGFIARSATSDAHALESARQLGQPFVVASALYFSLVRKALCRDYAAMAPKARELQALSEENGFPSFGPFSKFFVGCALVAERRSIEDGLSLMREGLEAQRYAGPNVNRAVLLATLADSLNQVGEIEAGLVTVQRGFDIAEVGEVRYMHAELLRLQGELSRAQGPAGAAAAMSLFRDAIDVACLQGSRSLQLRACVSLGRLWLAENRREEALALLRPIYGSFADGFNTLDLREAKALVDDLARIDVRAP